MFTRTSFSFALAGVCALGIRVLPTTAAPTDVTADPLAMGRLERAADLYQRGVWHYNKGNLETAIAFYTESLTLNPDAAVTYSARAGALGVLAAYDQAIADYTTAIALDEDLAAAYGGRGWAYYLQGNIDAGVVDLWQAATLFREQNQPEQYHKTLAIIEDLAP